MTGTWTSRPTDDPTIVDLFYTAPDADTPAKVGSWWWLHTPAHQAVAMTRLLDQLNTRPNPPQRAYDGQVWTVQNIECHPGVYPAGWGTFLYHEVEAAAVIWERQPRDINNLHNRLLAGLNPGNGLLAVTIPAIARSAA